MQGPGAIHVTVRDPLAPSHPISAQGVQGWHDAQEQDKRRKYGQMCNRLGWRLVPFVLDVWGGFGEEARALVGTLLKSLVGQKEGWQRREVEATVWQQLGFAAMREVGKQLVWSVHAAAEPVYAPMTHRLRRKQDRQRESENHFTATTGACRAALRCDKPRQWVPTSTSV